MGLIFTQYFHPSTNYLLHGMKEPNSNLGKRAVIKKKENRAKELSNLSMAACPEDQGPVPATIVVRGPPVELEDERHRSVASLPARYASHPTSDSTCVCVCIRVYVCVCVCVYVCVRTCVLYPVLWFYTIFHLNVQSQMLLILYTTL